MNIAVRLSSFIILLSSLSFTACGKNTADVASQAPVSAFKNSDFDSDSDSSNLEVEIPLTVRDPFQKPGGVPAEASSAHPPTASVHSVESVKSEPEAPPKQETVWPVIVLSGMMCGADGTWCAGVDGRILKVGDWITPSIRILKADPNGIFLVDKSGNTRRITINKKGI